MGVADLDDGPVGGKLKEKADQLWALQALLKDPIDLDLRTQYLDTSSTPAEVEARKNEVRYQIQLLQAVLTILSDELKLLEQSQTGG